MKKLLYLFVIIIALSACKKEITNQTIIVEPPVEKLISRDTVKSGQVLGLNIGDSPSEVYTTIQNIYTENSVGYLSIIGNIYTKLEGLENKIPLYSSIILDEKIGTASGIQIAFANDKVKSIYTNDGVQLNNWPLGVSNTASISVNDPIDGIYKKLVDLNKITPYAKQMEQISIFEKNIKTPIDPQMKTSNQWNFNSAPADNKTYYRLELHFKDGKLNAIYSATYEK